MILIIIINKWLLKEGYIMLQWSVYARLCNGLDRAQKHMDRIKPIVPPKGSVRASFLNIESIKRFDEAAKF